MQQIIIGVIRNEDAMQYEFDFMKYPPVWQVPVITGYTEREWARTVGWGPVPEHYKLRVNGELVDNVHDKQNTE